MIPWALYNLTPRDQGSPLIRPFFAYEAVTVANPATTSIHVFQIPDEEVLLVTSCGCWVETAGGDPTQSVQMVVRDAASGNTVWSMREPRPTGAATGYMGIHFKGSPLCLVGGQNEILITSRLNAASTNPWESQAEVAGVLIPRGTLARV